MTEFPVFAVIVTLILLLCSGLISGAEVAFFSLNIKLVEQQVNDQKFVGRLKRLLSNPRKLLATILITNNFINIGIVLLFAYIFQFIFRGNLDFVLIFIIEVGVITGILLVFGEILPKTFASRNPLIFARFMLIPLEFIDRYALFVFSKPMSLVGSYIEDKFGNRNQTFSLDRVSQALELTRDEETSEEEQKILKGILNFGNIEAKQIMCPRVEMYSVDWQLSTSQVIEQITRSAYSRIPVYKENLDEIVGVLYIKDLLSHIDNPKFNWHKVLRDPYYVPENKKLDNLLINFKKEKTHMAILVDEYGGTSGLITLEDILEQVVGDIQDEHDEKIKLQHKKIDKTNYQFDAKINLMDFFKIIGANRKVFETVMGDAESLGGLLLEINKEFPSIGTVIQFKKYQFMVEKIEDNRITQVGVTIPSI